MPDGTVLGQLGEDGVDGSVAAGVSRRWTPCASYDLDEGDAGSSNRRWHDWVVIVVVEGPSAAGKTTWASAHGPDYVVPETGRIDLPDDIGDGDLTRFWNDLNCARWAEAVQVEATRGIAVCDTDPLKLHYDYCLARIGAAGWDRFEDGVAEAAEAIDSHRLGIADVVLVSMPDTETLTRQRDSDSSRVRRNFDLHRRLVPGLRDWYRTLERLDPGRVRWEFPDQMPTPLVRERYDTELFRAWMEGLPRHVGDA